MEAMFKSPFSRWCDQMWLYLVYLLGVAMTCYLLWNWELAVHEDAATRVIHGLPQREEDHQAHDNRFDRRSVERNGDYDDLGS